MSDNNVINIDVARVERLAAENNELKTEIAETVAETPFMKRLTQFYANGVIPEPVFNELTTHFIEGHIELLARCAVNDVLVQRVANGETRVFEKDGTIYSENIAPVVD